MRVPTKSGLLVWLALLSFVGNALAQEGTADLESTPPAASEDELVKNYDDLVALLKTDGVTYEGNPTAGYVAIATRRGLEDDPIIESVMVIRWAEDDGVVHFVQIIPVELPLENLPAVESAILRLNHAYPIPGLGINHTAGAVYFRFSVPFLPRGGLSPAEVRQYFLYTLDQAAALKPTIEAVAAGEVKPEHALSYHNALAELGTQPFGTWKRTIGNDNWELTIQPDGTAELHRNGETVLSSVARIQQQVIYFEDSSGPLAAEGQGRYEISFPNPGEIQFTVMEDANTERQTILTDGAWTK